jgi:hypothetical protein
MSWRHFAQCETGTGERWQFEGELLYRLGTGRKVGKIFGVEHDPEFCDELRVISSTTFLVHGGDRITSTIDPSTSSNDLPSVPSRA